MKILVLGSDGSLGGELFNKLALTEDVVGISMKAVNDGDWDQIELDIEHFGSYDQVYNIHGVNHLSHIGESFGRLDSRIMDINVNAYYNIVHLVKKYQYTPCKVLNMASVAHRVAMRKSALYCASKAAVVQLTKVMARELAPEGWVVNCIAPGLFKDTVMTEMTEEQIRKLRGWTQEEADTYSLNNIPMGRYTSKDEVIEAMVKIMDLPSYINGSCIEMTGGV